MKMITHCFALLLIILFFFPAGRMDTATASPLQTVTLTRPITSGAYPVVIPGRELSPLLDHPINEITFFAAHGGALQPIPFQIDRRDRRGRFQLPSGKKQLREGRFPFDGNDEFVFMAADVGEKMTTPLPGEITSTSVAIMITDPVTKKQGWLYARTSRTSPERNTTDYVTYHRNNDTVESDLYRVGYSKRLPFIIQSLQWKDEKNASLSVNLIDTMKARHRGKFLHKLHFLRTEQDSTSKLLGVKDGPVRVIRSTKNRAKLFLGLKTPSILIDYIHYSHSLFMDIRIHIPFKIGLFFSDVETLMTIDGNEASKLPPTYVFSPSMHTGSLIDGKMSNGEKKINTSGDHQLAIVNRYGTILIGLQLAENLPLTKRVYLVDDKGQRDSPEHIPGQFGNVGFLTKGWETLKGSSYRMSFTIYMTEGQSPEKGFELLRNAPNFMDGGPAFP